MPCLGKFVKPYFKIGFYLQGNETRTLQYVVSQDTYKTADRFFLLTHIHKTFCRGCLEMTSVISTFLLFLELILWFLISSKQHFDLKFLILKFILKQLYYFVNQLCLFFGQLMFNYFVFQQTLCVDSVLLTYSQPVLDTIQYIQFS